MKRKEVSVDIWIHQHKNCLLKLLFGKKKELHKNNHYALFFLKLYIFTQSWNSGFHLNLLIQSCNIVLCGSKKLYALTKKLRHGYTVYSETNELKVSSCIYLQVLAHWRPILLQVHQKGISKW